MWKPLWVPNFLFLTFRHNLGRVKIDFALLEICSKTKECIIRGLQRFHDTSNRIKILFSFYLWYFQTTTIYINLCKLLKTELVLYGLFLYKFNLYWFYRFLSLVGLQNYHKSDVNQIWMQFDVSWSLCELKSVQKVYLRLIVVDGVQKLLFQMALAAIFNILVKTTF